MPRIIDLFAGLGGIRLGFQEAMDVLGLKIFMVRTKL